MKKINIITLGCSKNLVDSEHLAGRLTGWNVVFDSNESANVVVINTCGFIGDAKQESIDTILQFAAARQRGEIERLYVIGCLSERYADELRKELPEVDDFFGARGLEEIFEQLRITNYELRGNTICRQKCSDFAPSEVSASQDSMNNTAKMTKREGAKDECFSRQIQRKISTPKHYAYLKISEGCDRSCGFCAIPIIRGPHVSVPMEQLVAEAQWLADEGVKELIVIAQDITYYGLDLYGKRTLAELLRRLAEIEGVEWIRLHYAYPAGFPDDVVELMRCEPKICKYIDIPLQHIAEGQLAAMKRGLDGQKTRELVAKLRAEIPDLALRTTLLVGYPGETEQDFEELVEFVRETRFERLGVFAYSPEEGTFSAENLPDDIPDEVKQQRVERIMELQAEISEALNEARVGTMERVIVDRREGERWICRSQYDSPEVDTEILLPASSVPAGSTENIEPGDFATVRITSASEYDLFAEILLNDLPLSF